MKSAKNQFFTTNNQAGYAYVCTTGMLFGESKTINTAFSLGKCMQDDIIDMYVDMNALTISFSLNDGDEETAFAKMDQDEYRAAVSIGNKEDELELVLYEAS